MLLMKAFGDHLRRDFKATQMRRQKNNAALLGVGLLDVLKALPECGHGLAQPQAGQLQHHAAIVGDAAAHLAGAQACLGAVFVPAFAKTRGQPIHQPPHHGAQSVQHPQRKMR